MSTNPWYRRSLSARSRWAMAAIVVAFLLVALLLDGTAALVLEALLFVALVVVFALSVRRAES